MRTKEARIAPYRDLVDATARTIDAARDTLRRHATEWSRSAEKISAKLRHFVAIGDRVVDQTRRRILEGESVPSAEKVVSIFEDHAAIIVKDRRDTQYGHKVTFVVGARGVVLDTVIEDGNPADATLVRRSIEHARDVLGSVPKAAAFDGSYASRANLEAAKAPAPDPTIEAANPLILPQ